MSVAGGWWGPMRDSAPHILSALRQLVSCPEVFRPFVLVEVMGAAMYVRRAGVFVQFAGSEERGILFDVPALNIVVEPLATPEAGVDAALAGLRAQGVPEDAVVRVRFESTRGGPHFVPAKA